MLNFFSLISIISFFIFRKKKLKTLLMIGLVFFVVPVLFTFLFSLSMPYWPQESIDQNMQSWLPSAERMQNELDIMRSSWLEQMDKRVETAIFLQTFLLLIISPIWLKHFRFGPLEWLWRVLTYWHYQPMKRVPKAS